MSAADASPIDGTWEMIRAEMNGDTAPEVVAMGVELELAAGRYVVRFGREVADRGTFAVGGTPDAKTILIEGAEGPNAGRIIPCLYQQVGERLRVCYGLDGVAPTTFETQPGSARYLATYRRKGG